LTDSAIFFFDSSDNLAITTSIPSCSSDVNAFDTLSISTHHTNTERWILAHAWGPINHKPKPSNLPCLSSPAYL
jgi:hypothetical protein